MAMLGWTRYHPTVLALTFCSRALMDVARKTLSCVKNSVASEWTPSPLATTTTTTGGGGGGGHNGDTWTRGASLFADEASAEAFLGLLNATFLFLKVFGLYVCGALADRCDLRLMISGGMALSALTLLLFGTVLHWAAAWASWAYLGLMALSGLVTSAAWPCFLAVITNWFGKKRRGLVLGLWSSSSNVGSIVCALMASAVVDYGYEYVFAVSTSVVVAGSVLIFFGLVTSPREVGLPMPDEVNDPTTITTRQGASVLRGGRVKVSSSGALNNISDTAPSSVNVPLIRRSDIPRCSYGSTRETASFENTHHDTAQQPSTGSSLLGKIRFPTQCQWSRRNGEDILLFNGEDDHAEDRHSYVDTNRDGEDQDEKSERGIPLSKTPETPPEKADPGSSRCLTSNIARKETETSSNNRPSHHKPRAKAINFFAALKLPGVVPYSLAYAFLKMVQLVFYYWLPFYLTSANGLSQAAADKLSVWFDVGGILSCTVIGGLISLLDKRALVVGPMLALAIPTLYVYGTLPAGQDLVVNVVMLVALGVMIGGVANIFSAAISSDLGRQDAIRGNQEAMATVVGILSGTGALGAVVGQLAVPYVADAFGWSSVFYLLMAAISLTVLNLTPMIINELKEVVRNRSSNS